ncbi:MAG: cyclic nucleotide-binding domain-containing protein [Spirochaetaceae bacterium]|jgi:CRP-like cAMP-binding protein|nr:cyclic nucleotide-binding domain-containing protein [Spirochaetaceae bacterium]
MPRSIDYKKGAIVYFEGDKADKIYVLQDGQIDIASRDIETNEYSHDIIGPGEFFGVKSAIGNYAREDAANVLKDSKVMAFSVQEFEAFCMGNARIVMKMLKVFSNQLRDIHKQLSEMIQQKDTDPDDGLYNIGELFLKQSKYDKAYYVLKRYIAQYPNGKNIANAKKNFSILEKMGVKD